VTRSLPPLPSRTRLRALRPNQRLYLQTLRGMTAEQRLMKAFELSELSHELLRAGIRQRYPDAAPDEVRRIYLEQLERCRNRP
jgi:hypothetical protein